MQGTRTVASVPERLTGYQFQATRWTLDGRYVVFLTIYAIGKPLLDQTLVSIDTESGAVARLPCPDCTTIVGDGGDEVLAYQADYQQIWSVTLRSGKPSQETRIAIPKAVSDDHFIIGAKGQAVLAITNVAQSAATSNSESFYLVTAHGAVRELAAAGSESEVAPIAATGHSAIGDATIAMGDSVHGGACQRAGFIHMLDPTNGVETQVELVDAYPPNYEPGRNGGLEIHDLWWDDKGYLYATVESWICNGGDRKITTPSSLWRFDGKHWTKTDAGPLAMVRTLAGGGRLVLSQHADFTTYNEPIGGPLYLEQGSLSRTNVATNALYISTPDQASIP
ncbi:hypothetical protein Caci_7323 [Catenulispora acidiphila DSM 44928]|uniref:Uncharacterized protein n=2 Tax=Catenulispora TaxID=414878 RepID=C7Q8G4_CATAD|nr:hypothetical protein Caci_7323 [Catenulispora acidiphila DSM 44928]